MLDDRGRETSAFHDEDCFAFYACGIPLGIHFFSIVIREYAE